MPKSNSIRLGVQPQHTNITPVLRDTLHWLPVTQCIDYKIALMTYSCVHGTSPAYFNGICRPVASVEGCAMLRSANYGELIEHQMRGKRYGPRSFRVAAPFVWNYLPRHLRNDDISREQFTRDLKTFLFARAYSSEAPLRTPVQKALYKWTYLLTYLQRDRHIHTCNPLRYVKYTIQCTCLYTYDRPLTDINVIATVCALNMQTNFWYLLF